MDLINQDLKYNWHPYTQMKDYEDSLPLLIEKAKGIKLFDANGKYYYDSISSWWCNIHGHNHPIITKAINNQLKIFDHVLFAGFTHESAILLSKKIISIAPRSLTKVFYSDNGSTAVETAVKMSFQYWKNIGIKNKTKFVTLDMAYHGDTVGCMSLSGIDLFNKKFSPLFFKTHKIPTPYCYRCPMVKDRENCRIECIKPLEKLLKNKAKEISAIIIEPIVLAAAGMIIYPKEYLKKVADLAREYNVHLILDEVAVGFGRTGKMFASEWANVQPDFMCLSKGITNGTLPLGATLTTDKIYEAFYDDFDKKKTFYHGHTFCANAIGCSAALACLEIFKSEKPLNNAKKISGIFKKEMPKFMQYPFVGDIRTIGVIAAIELVKNKKTKEPFTFGERVGYKIYKEGLKNNLILRSLGNIIYLYLPLSTKEKELRDILNKMHKTLQNIVLPLS